MSLPANGSTFRGGLKHLPFFEVIGHEEEDSPHARVAKAGLLLLRLIDHWFLVGAVMVGPESQSIRSVRNAISSLPRECPQRDLLFGLVNAMQTARDVDVEVILPRLLAYARLLEYENGRDRLRQMSIAGFVACISNRLQRLSLRSSWRGWFGGCSSRGASES